MRSSTGALRTGLAVLAGLLLLVVLAVLLRVPVWKGPVYVAVENATYDSILVDVRWWGGPRGVDGPIAQSLAPDSATLFARGTLRGAACVRVIDPSTGRVSAQALPTGTHGGDTVRVGVSPAMLSSSPEEDASCPDRLAFDRVLVTLTRYFEPGEPNRLRRQPLIQR